MSSRPPGSRPLLKDLAFPPAKKYETLEDGEKESEETTPLAAQSDRPIGKSRGILTWESWGPGVEGPAGYLTCNGKSNRPELQCERRSFYFRVYTRGVHTIYIPDTQYHRDKRVLSYAPSHYQSTASNERAPPLLISNFVSQNPVD